MKVIVEQKIETSCYQGVREYQYNEIPQTEFTGRIEHDIQECND